MSRQSSINALRHNYQRSEAWTVGVRSERPLIENFSNRVALGETLSPRQKVMAMFQGWNDQWTKRPDNWRKLNGYPE